MQVADTLTPDETAATIRPLRAVTDAVDAVETDYAQLTPPSRDTGRSALVGERRAGPPPSRSHVSSNKPRLATQCACGGAVIMPERVVDSRIPGQG